MRVGRGQDLETQTAYLPTVTLAALLVFAKRGLWGFTLLAAILLLFFGVRVLTVVA